MGFGRLERTQGPQPMSDINVTPLVDVMLVLVVILIITAPLLASAIRLDLPRADGSQPGEPPRFVTVALDKNGNAFFNDKPVSAPELAEQLTAVARQNRDTEIQLRADQGVPYGRVVEVMGAAHAAGLSRIGFVAEPAGK
ncbi:MAG TPA: biopolymer transporter ExbD [Ramlibacter sp.]|jgi:biopolymer transport protein TolR